jgi:DNA repair exonuclease SbcCD ATPase subunit
LLGVVGDRNISTRIDEVQHMHGIESMTHGNQSPPESHDTGRESASPISNNPLASADDEMLDWLQAEVVQLQYEVAERDARIAELTQTGECGADEHHDDAIDSHLLVRLDELLDELALSDERTQGLEELLRAAEEANRAEIEERRQLESWVGDIERRTQEREAEWQAQIEMAQSRLDEEISQRRQLAEQLNDTFQGRGVEARQRQEIERLQDSCRQLREKLDAGDRQRAALATRLKNVDAMQSEQWCRSQLDEALRVERVKLAQERAELARLRAELTARTAELNLAPKTKTRDIDNRVRAFRDHLREIHDKESQERLERSMSARISKLWKQLGGAG